MKPLKSLFITSLVLVAFTAGAWAQIDASPNPDPPVGDAAAVPAQTSVTAADIQELKDALAKGSQDPIRWLEERIAAKLGHPTFDPHGHCIPAMDGKMPKQLSKPLTDIEEDGKVFVESVSDQDALLLKQHLERLQLFE